MILRKRNIFAFAVVMFPLAMVNFPWLVEAKSFYAIIQGLALFIVICILMRLHEIKILKSQVRLAICLILFLIILILSAWNSGSISTFNSVFQYAKYLVYALIMGIYLVNIKIFNLENVLSGFSVTICLMAVTCLTDQMNLSEFYKYSYDFEVRTVGLLGPPNKSSLLLAFAIGFNINAIIRNQFSLCLTLKNVTLFTLTAVAIGALIISASRSGLILTLVFTSMLFVNYFKYRKLRSMVTFFVIIFCSVLLVVSVLPDRERSYFRLRILSSIAFIFHPTGKEIMGASLSNRILAISDAVMMATENPMFGVGPGKIKDARIENPTNYLPSFLSLGRKTHFGLTAHNTFLNTFAECGVPAGLILIIIVCLMLKTFYLKWKLTGGYAECVMFSYFCTYVIFMLSQSVLWRNNLLFSLFVPLSLSFGFSKLDKQNKALRSFARNFKHHIMSNRY